MSIVNAFIVPDDSVALLAVDTAALTNSGAVLETNKMIVLPHCNAVIGFRGTLLFGSHLHRHVIFDAFSFDSLSYLFEVFFMRALRDTIEEAPSRQIDPAVAMKAEAVLVGYSSILGRIVMHHLRHENEESDLIASRDIRSIIAPWDDIPACSLDGIFADREGLITLAKRQVDIFDEQYPGTMGKELYIAEVGCNSITIEHAATLSV